MEYDAERTFLKTTTTVEELRSKSTFVPVRASGLIYKYVNVKVGVKGGGLPTSIANGLIGFKVEKLWINNNAVNESLVTLQWYNTSWESLYTKKVGEDYNYSYFVSTAPGFSFFAITYTGEADKNVTQIGAKLNSTLESLVVAGNILDKTGNNSNADVEKEAGKVLLPIILPLFLIFLFYLWIDRI